MEISRKACRLCLVETEFNISLFSNYCHRTNMVDKILVCLKLVIEETDVLNTICYKCANNVEKYYDFITSIKKCQTKMGNTHAKIGNSHQTSLSFNMDEPAVKRHVTSYVREQVIDADYTFSFLEIPKEEKKEAASSSPFFSYFSPVKKDEPVWKTPRMLERDNKRENKQEKYKRPLKSAPKSKHLSGDLFESQSQDEENGSEKDWSEWKFTPDSNIIKKVREKCFGRLDF